VLFIVGGVVALITLPQALDFLLSAGGEDLQPLLTADKYISLVTLMILAFGLAFEFPVLLVFLLIARVLTTARLSKWRRWAIVLIFAFAAVITPSQDPYSLFFMAVPMIVFYEASILVGKALKR
jgi:sec-independent protein translocase protein TatC